MSATLDRGNVIGRYFERKILDWANARARQGDPSAYAVRRALNLAKHHHTGRRKNGDWEINHPLAVAYLFVQVAEACESQGYPLPLDVVDGLKAMLCHDILEDKLVTRSELRGFIGERAEQIVFGMSKKYLDENRVLVHKNDDAQEALHDLIAIPFALAGRYVDRSHNLGTMVAVDGAYVASQVVYDPEKQLRKLKEAVFELIPAGDPEAIAMRYDPVYGPFVGIAQAYLIYTVSAVYGLLASADMLRTFQEWRNTEQQHRLLESIRFPEANDGTLHSAFTRTAARIPPVVAATPHHRHSSSKRKPASAAMAPTG